MRKTGIIQSCIIMLFTQLSPIVLAQTNVTLGLGSMTMRLNAVVADAGVSNIVYPREYSVYSGMGRCFYGRGFLIVAKDFKTKWTFSDGQWRELEQETLVPYFISEATPSYHQDRTHSAVELNITKYWKYKAPYRLVNLENFSDDDWQPYDEVGGTGMLSDQMAIANCNTAHGIRITQRAFAFADPNYDDFIIVEYVFKNTGSIDRDRIIEYTDNKISDCYIGLKFVPQVSGLTGLIIPGAGGWMPQIDDWLDYYAGSYDGEPVRVMYSWDGDARAEYYSEDDEGDPFPASGLFMSTQYPGMAILHVDRAVNDPVNDPAQPIMSYYSWGGAIATNTLSMGTGGMGAEAIYRKMSTKNYFTSPFDWDTWNTSATEIWNTGYGNDPNAEYYKTGTLGFGPYNFENLGDSLRIVVCYAVGSLGWTKTVELGTGWKSKLPNPSADDRKEKNRLIRSGRDSLLAKVVRVTRLFKNSGDHFDLQKGADLIGDPPPAPGLSVSSDLEAVYLEWEDVGAAKYRIYRRLKPTFSLEDEPGELAKDPYPLVQEVDGGITQWRDTSVSIGQHYWYCVTAVDANGLESGKFLTRTDPTSNNRTRGGVQPNTSAPSTALDSVYVVPNPYHRKSEQLYSGVMTADNIRFYGLPPQCRIRIYTQSGDLVATLEHELTYPPSTVYTWNMLTDSDQYIASGLYFFTVDQAKDHLGNDVDRANVGKFVIIR